MILQKIYSKLRYYRNALRIFKSKILGANIAKGVLCYGRFSVAVYPNLTIGKRTTINEGVHFNCSNKVTIGSDVHISTSAQLHTGKLILDMDNRVHEDAPIIIEDNVWIASSAVILAGVTIGKNSVIAAGSIVTKDVEKNSLMMGVPARLIKKI